MHSGTNNDNDHYESGLEWKKIEQEMKKVGLREGLSDGRESNFQQSFDKGYEDGFRNGFDLGKLKFIDELSGNTNILLQNMDKAMCIVCTTEKDNLNVEDVRKKQTELLEANLYKLSLRKY
ncbi:uncharacterized protein LOC115883417 [Sitophilus oryzae]|uniref:Uncharacterized protein LOC115883417 n=1 Tax=Sitophilus oryzae TaxID=7048 RepID=A0A6J2Y2Z0_SITOR|nr:uncharacterized protein LOC115883417 [Sitophilus oryzae]